MFLHIGFVHFLVNMFTLLSIGSTLEKYFGTLKYMALYALAGIGGSLASAFSRDILAAGASGALFGLCGGAAYLGFRYSKEIPAILRKQLAGGMISCIGYNLLYGFISSGIDNAAHIGGLLVGVIYAMIVSPPVIKGKEKESVNIYSLVFLLIGIIPFITQFYISYLAIYKTGFENYPLREYRDESNKDLLFKYPTLLSVKEYPEGKGLAGPGMFMQVSSFDTKDNLDIRTESQELLNVLEEKGTKIKEHKLISVNNREWLMVNINTEKGLTYYLLFTCHENKLFRIEMAIADNFLAPGKEIMNLIMENFLPGK